MRVAYDCPICPWSGGDARFERLEKRTCPDCGSLVDPVVFEGEEVVW